MTFTHFIVFAEMRTGSNFLEQNINKFTDLTCLGELFNPKFAGFPDTPDPYGISKAQRDTDPLKMLDAVKSDPRDGISGFRYFFDHDPRVLSACLEDHKCAKIILTRNPLDSYVSRKIAMKTGQWKLTDMKHKLSAQIKFNATEFQDHIDELQRFQLRLLNALQTSGQAPFYISYDDINSLDVLNGMARFLGSNDKISSLKKQLKRQNPSPLEDKVSNYDEMSEALRNVDFLNLTRTPNFEPRRGARVPGFLAGDNAPLLFLPIKGSVEEPIISWMKAHENDSELIEGFNQKTLRQWKRKREGHVSFSVVRHPVVRAHHVFCQYILRQDRNDYTEVREVLRDGYGLNLPLGDASISESEHRAVFLDFLVFLKGNLAEQTGVRIDLAWATQTAILQGAASVVLPSQIIHEDRLEVALGEIEQRLGLDSQTIGSEDLPDTELLTEIYDKTVEKAVRDVYMRDYLSFGFGDWKP